MATPAFTDSRQLCQAMKGQFMGATEGHNKASVCQTAPNLYFASVYGLGIPWLLVTTKQTALLAAIGLPLLLVQINLAWIQSSIKPVP